MQSALEIQKKVNDNGIPSLKTNVPNKDIFFLP